MSSIRKYTPYAQLRGRRADLEVGYQWRACKSNSHQIEKVLELDNHITSMSWLQGTVGTQELLAAGCANGSFKLISKGTRVEKNVPDAHSGAVSIA